MRRVYSYPVRALFLLVLAIAALFLVANSAEAKPWTISYTASLSSNGAAARADRTTNVLIPGAPAPLPFNSFFSQLIQITPLGFHLYRDGEVPDGAVIANNNNFVRLGFANGPCTNPFPVPLSGTLEVLDATTNNSNLVTFADANDTGPDNLPKGVTRYPVAVESVFPQSVTGVPRSRGYAQTTVITTEVEIHFLQYDPGSLGLSASLGSPSLSFFVTGDPGAPVPGNVVTDSCPTFLSQVRTLGVSQDNVNTTPTDEGGFHVSQNPSVPGPYSFGLFGLSLRDGDDDKFDNSDDTCPLKVNVEDVRVAGAAGDPDGFGFEGIDSTCDPLPAANNGLDADGDGFFNRGDNCPLVYNPSQLDSETLAAGTFASDGGPKGDDIGDACDPAPLVENGHYHTTSPTGTSGPLCIPGSTCGDICLSGYVFVGPTVAGGQFGGPNYPGPDASSPPGTCSSVNPGCVVSNPTCTTPPSPPVRFSSVVIGPAHDIRLSGVGGAQRIKGAQTRTYTVAVENGGDGTEDIQVALKVDVVTASCSVTAGANQTGVATAVPSGGKASVSFSVTFGGCGGTGTDTTSPDYIVRADACHSGDPAPSGFFGVGVCPGAFDGTADGNPLNDAPKQRAVNDTDR